MVRIHRAKGTKIIESKLNVGLSDEGYSDVSFCA